MSYHLAGPKRIVRPFLKRTAVRIWPFWRDSLGFALAISLGWAAAWFAFARWEAALGLPFVFPMIAVPIGIFVATVYRLRVRPTTRRLDRAIGIAFVVPCALLIGLHFVREKPRRFGFLGSALAVSSDQQSFFPTDWRSAYRLSLDYKSVVHAARPELLEHGYRIDERGDSFLADRSFDVHYPGSVFPVRNQVSIAPGWSENVTEGPKAESGKTTVWISQPETLPVWLRMFVP